MAAQAAKGAGATDSITAFLAQVGLWTSSIGFIIQIWLFVTPVLYPLRTVPRAIRPFYLANPMTGVVDSFRRVLVYGQSPEIGVLWPTLLGTGVVLLLALLRLAFLHICMIVCRRRVGGGRLGLLTGERTALTRSEVAAMAGLVGLEGLAVGA